MSFISALGLDVGKKRIGVAGCDGTGLIATGLTTIERSSFAGVVEELSQWVVERRVQILVIGMPYRMNGEIGKQAQYVQRFAHSVSKALDRPVDFVDERLTSFAAEQLMLAQNISPARNKALIDQKAAAIILQQWLDQRRNPKNSSQL
jgi:putative holliday junction resolvase